MVTTATYLVMSPRERVRETAEVFKRRLRGSSVENLEEYPLPPVKKQAQFRGYPTRVEAPSRRGTIAGVCSRGDVGLILELKHPKTRTKELE
ncbi:hypothetical protein SDJN03_23706, partial [Cucurbita argyrosperma subsp. sororia]